MLTFLNSAILFGLAAVTIPILIHLFTRQKTKTILFSSLKFLKELQKKKIRRLKIRQILLLILRALLILALVLAFARPTLRSRDITSIESGAQLTAVIILDNTLSMGRISNGRRLLDEAKERAREIVSLMRPGDEIYLLYPQSPPKFAHEGARYSLESMQKLIETTEISYHRTDYAAALLMANQLMAKSQNINKEIYLVCDLQKNGLNLSETATQGLLLNDDVRLFVLPVLAKDEDNLAASDLTIGNQILEKGKVAEVQARIKNTTDSHVKNKLAHLFVDGKRLSQNEVDLAPGASANLVFKIVPDRSGFQAGYILLEDDNLLEDNRRYFAFNIPEEIPVLLVGNKPDDTHFIKLALRPQKDIGSYIKVTEINVNQFIEQDLSKFKAVIFSNVPRLTDPEIVKLENFIKPRGGFFSFLGPDVDLRNYNDKIHDKLKLPQLTQTISKQGQEQFLSIGKIDYSHPVFKGVFGEEKSVASPHVRFAVEVSKNIMVDNIIEYSNGAPFLFESKLGSGHILYITTSISQDWSDLIFRGLFVPLINRGIVYLSGAASAENEQVLVGSEIRYFSENLTAGADMAMEKPDGGQVKIKPEISSGNYFIRYGETDMPGAYRLFNNAELISQWVVNYDPEELDNTKLDMDDLKKYAAPGQLVEIDSGASISASLQETRFGREFWKSLMMFALLLILAETILFREKGLQEKSE